MEPPKAAGLAKVLAFLPRPWGPETYPSALAPRFQGSTNPQVLPRSLADKHRWESGSGFKLQVKGVWEE